MTTFLALAGAPGDAGAGAEARTIFDAIDGATSSFSNIVRLRLFYTRRSDFAPLHAVRQPYFAQRLPDMDYPATTGLITGGRAGAPPVLEAQAMLGSGKTTIYTPDVWRSIRGGSEPLPVSHGCGYDGMLFVSGQVAYDRDAQVAGETLEAQIDRAWANFAAIVAQAGSSLADLAAVTVYVVAAVSDQNAAGMDHFAARLRGTGAVRPPVVSWVGVEELFQPGLLVEIEGAVALGGGVCTAAPRVDLPGTPPCAPAAAVAGWSFATGVARCAGAEAIEGAVGEAWAMLADGLDQVGRTTGGLGQLTAWCEPACAGAVAELLAQRAPTASITVVPLAGRSGADGRIVVEAIGHRS
jgi:enamine deaminase RidA (YjgF/YER057c/UK114 family)